MTGPNRHSRNMLRMPHMEEKLKVCRTTMYSWGDPSSPYFDPTWPKPVKLGARAVAWDEALVDAWIESRSTAGRNQDAPKNGSGI